MIDKLQNKEYVIELLCCDGFQENVNLLRAIKMPETNIKTARMIPIVRRVS